MNHQFTLLSASSATTRLAKSRAVFGATISAFTLALGLFAAAPAQAQAANDTVAIKIKDHKFEPANFEIPADKKIKLVITNQDATPEEFESDDLRREKLVPAGKEVVVFIGPLKPGVYKFKGEFNPTTAQGTVTVK